MRKIVLTGDAVLLGHLNVTMPSITVPITEITFDDLTFVEGSQFVQIQNQSFRKSNFKFNQMEATKPQISPYQSNTIAETVKNRRGLPSKVTNFGHLSDPNVEE